MNELEKRYFKAPTTYFGKSFERACQAERSRACRVSITFGKLESL